MADQYKWYIDQRYKNLERLGEINQAYTDGIMTTEEYDKECIAINIAQQLDDTQLLKQYKEQKTIDIDISSIKCLCGTYNGWTIDEKTYNILKNECEIEKICSIMTKCTVICHICKCTQICNAYLFKVHWQLCRHLKNAGLKFDILNIDKSHFCYQEHKLRVYLK